MELGQKQTILDNSKRTSNYHDDIQEAENDDGFVYFNGEYYLIRDAKLYSPPTSYIPIFIAAAGPESTKASAKYSDGLITFLKANESQRILDVFDKTVKVVIVGFTKVYVHSTSPNEIEFVQEFGKKVLPYFEEQAIKNR